jgi:hypothetical protein
MKRAIALMVAIALLLPAVLAIDTGIGFGINVTTQPFPPHIWMCDSRVVIDDDIEPGRVDGCPVTSLKFELCEDAYGNCETHCVQDAWTWWTEICGDGLGEEFPICQLQPPEGEQGSFRWCETVCTEELFKHPCEIFKGYTLTERHNNYAFEGEKIEWLVLVMDKNKIEQIREVVATVSTTQDPSNPVSVTEVECVELHGFAMPGEQLLESCNARIEEEELDQFDDQTMAYYECTLTVEPGRCLDTTGCAPDLLGPCNTCLTGENMRGEYWVQVQAYDGTTWVAADEDEYWFFNPVVALTLNGALNFHDVRPGTVRYSDTVTVGNAAEGGSGVMLDMFITGTDFYDPSNSGARCVITNRLKLGNNYVAPGLDYSGDVCTIGFGDADDHLCYHATSGSYSTQGDRRADAEGYVPIYYGDRFTQDLYNDAELIQQAPMGPAPYWMANLLTPGSEMSVTFKLGLPEPCVGSFSQGRLNFWAEAV